MKIHLPNSAFLGNIDAFIQSFDNSNKNELEITANKKWISLHPVVLSMVAVLGMKVGSKNIRCEKLEAASKHYFERIGLFRSLGISSGIDVKKHESAGKFIPITNIRNSTALTDFIQDTVPLLHLEQAQAETIKYILSELIRNVLEHSGDPNGAFVCAQYYKKSNRIGIGIADGGMGLKRSLKKSHIVADDLDAIKLALTPGITGTTSKEGGTEYNAGAGLFFTKSIASVNKDYLVVYTGSALYKLLKRKTVKIKLFGDAFKDRHSKSNSNPVWDGTAIGIDITLDDTQEFSDILDIIRKIFLESIKERKRERKKPRFT